MEADNNRFSRFFVYGAFAAVGGAASAAMTYVYMANPSLLKSIWDYRGDDEDNDFEFGAVSGVDARLPLSNRYWRGTSSPVSGESLQLRSDMGVPRMKIQRYKSETRKQRRVRKKRVQNDIKKLKENLLKRTRRRQRVEEEEESRSFVSASWLRVSQLYPLSSWSSSKMESSPDDTIVTSSSSDNLCLSDISTSSTDSSSSGSGSEPKMSLQASLDLSLMSLRSQLVDSSSTGRVKKWNLHLTT
eukprot:g3686.t1